MGAASPLSSRPTCCPLPPRPSSNPPRTPSSQAARRPFRPNRYPGLWDTPAAAKSRSKATNPSLTYPFTHGGRWLGGRKGLGPAFRGSSKGNRAWTRALSNAGARFCPLFWAYTHTTTDDDDAHRPPPTPTPIQYNTGAQHLSLERMKTALLCLSLASLGAAFQTRTWMRVWGGVGLGMMLRGWVGLGWAGGACCASGWTDPFRRGV